MTQGSYKQFCPVAMAAEVLSTRWTIVLLRELLAGSTRFNDLRRGVPRMSPALLSQRLKDLEAAGVVRRSDPPPRRGSIISPPAGQELGPVVMAFGHWGQRWIRSELSLAVSRCPTFDVGHAPQPQSRAHAQAAQRDPFPISRTEAAGTQLVAAGRSPFRHRPLLHRSRLSRSISMSPPISKP